MTKNKYLHKNYTTNRSAYQLRIPIELEHSVPENDSVRLLSQVIEEIDLTGLYATYYRINKRHVTPKQMLKVVLYGVMNRTYSSRDLESACKRDINFMYLLEGAPKPDHSTIARFKSLHFEPCAKEIMAQVSKYLLAQGELSQKQIFIDGTKIEANANKYTFVWKKSVTKHLGRLLQKLADFVAKCETDYGIKIVYRDKVRPKHLKKLRKQLYRIKIEENISFVHGKGKRKTPLQRSIEELEYGLKKLKEYTQKLYISGKRNSFSKTDHDATFMRLKEDAMRNGQLKPAYNVQFGVDAEYIVWLTVGPQPNDTRTLIPFLKEAKTHLGFKYPNIVCDAGYESEENYIVLETNKQTAYIKPSNYERAKKRKYKSNIGRFENMAYCPQTDVYTCKNGKQLKVIGSKKSKSATGYVSLKTHYQCEDCSDCSHKTACIKGNRSQKPLEERTKGFQISKLFLTKRRESLNRITSPLGINLRINRSIQVEGAFGNTKSNMRFRRFLSRGSNNVLTETILLALGHNINKLHSKIQNDHTGKYLLPYKEPA